MYVKIKLKLRGIGYVIFIYISGHGPFCSLNEHYNCYVENSGNNSLCSGNITFILFSKRNILALVQAKDILLDIFKS